MAAFEDKLSHLVSEASKLGLDVDEGLLGKVAKGLGPALYNDDASLVSTSDPEEMARVKSNFLMKKLGLTDDKAMDDAIAEVSAQFGSSNRNKFRAIFYYLLVEHFGKAGEYNE